MNKKKFITLLLVIVIVVSGLLLLKKRKADLALAAPAMVLPAVVATETLQPGPVLLTLPAMGMVAVIVIASLFSEERCWTLRPAGPHYFERIHAIRAADKALENESDDYAAGATINLPNGQIIGTVGVCSRARHQDYDHEFARLIKKYAEELIAAF